MLGKKSGLFLSTAIALSISVSTVNADTKMFLI